MKIALCQINTTVGDLRGNLEKVRASLDRARKERCDLAVFPELTLPGYPPRDLVDRRRFVRLCAEALQEAARAARGLTALVGTLEENPGPGRPAYNAAAAVSEGRVLRVFRKVLLPNYDVFDEHRNFEAGETPGDPLEVAGKRVAVTVCEDIWNEPGFLPRDYYRKDPVADLAKTKPDLLVNLSSSPYHAAKPAARLELLRRTAAKTRCPVAYTNLVGGNDELVFDGHSMVVDTEGRLLAQARGFEEDFLGVEIPGASPRDPSFPAEEEELFRALTLGLRDYAAKCGFQRAVVGLSGGVDSSLVAVLAASALGPQNVLGVTLPSMYSSLGSVQDSRRLAETLGIGFVNVSITQLYQTAVKELSPLFAGKAPDVTEENLQARLRGLLLMAVSNKEGRLLLSTGNKSELAMGYCTLYGDMSGGLAVISDLPKTWVYRLARWVNRQREVIPRQVLEKPPSAELRPDQKDQDTLPPYEVLDAMLRVVVEEDGGLEDLQKAGFPEYLSREVLRRVDRNEYKRRQMAPGLKVTAKAFGMGRRYPIAQKYVENL